MNEKKIKELKDKYGYDEMSDDEREEFEAKIFKMIYGDDNQIKQDEEPIDKIDIIDKIDNLPRFM